MKGFESLTSKYIFISLILLICMGIFIYADFLFTQELKGDEKKIDLAGRERMLSISMAFHTSLIIDLPPSIEEDALLSKAEESMDEYEKILNGLKHGSSALNLKPIPMDDKESVDHIDTLIDRWVRIQKPAILSLMKLPAERKKEACVICHSTIRENLSRISGLVKSLQIHYSNRIMKFNRVRIYTLLFYLGVGVFILLYIRKNLVIPIIVLRDAASKVERGSYGVRVAISNKDEIGGLSRSFNQMTHALDMAFSENKELMNSLTEARIAAEAASQAKSDFLANVSHELRTPLNAVLGFSEIMKDGMAGPVTEEQKEYLDDIMESGQHLLNLINDILDLSKIEAGKVELEMSEFDMRELIERGFILFKEKSFNHRIDAVYEIEDGIGNVVADERRIKQVLFNLLSNAFKFTPDGGKVTVRVRKIPGDPEQIECCVEDTGIGIKKEEISRLFKPFEQLESVLTKEHGGTGLGLALCKKIMELHGGKIWTESEFGKGSRFIFIFPARSQP